MKASNAKCTILSMRYPPITTYSTETNLLAIFSGNDAAMYWFYETYFQLFAQQRFPRSTYLDFWAPLPWQNCPFLEVRSEKKIAHDSIIEILTAAIDNLEYVFLTLDQAYLFEPVDSLNPHVHETLIYGYNMPDKLFYLADFFGERYRFITCTFRQVEDAYIKCDPTLITNDAFNDILFLRFCENPGYEINIDRYLGNLKAYLDATVVLLPGKQYRSYYYEHAEQHMFGIRVYDFLLQAVDKEVRDSHGRIDYRGFHMLYEHKRILSLAMAYFRTKSILDLDSVLDTLLNTLTRQITQIRNMVLKYNIGPKQEILQRVMENLEKSKKADLELTETIYHQLSL